MRVRVEGRRARPVEIVIDELVVDREVVADPRRLEAALARELDRRLALEPGLAELRGRSREMGRMVAAEVAARSGPVADRQAPAVGSRGAASTPAPSGPVPAGALTPGEDR